MPMAYEGPLPYIFVSYSHRDKEFVHSVIRHLQDAGCRVWFDGGIEAGSEWPEYIATHLEGCHCVLSFISGSFVESDNCKRELNFAQDLKKPMLNVYIEEVALSAGMRMQLGLNQAMFRSNAKNDREFMDALARARILDECKETPAATPAQKTRVPHDTSAPVSHRDTVEFVEKESPAARTQTAAAEKESAPAAAKQPKTAQKKPSLPLGVKLLLWITIGLELSYCAAFPCMLRFATGMDMGIFPLILFMAVPHILIAIVNLLLVRHLRTKTTYPQREAYVMSLFFLNPVTSVVATFIGTSFMPYAIGGFLKFLFSLGLNVLPTVIVFLIYAGMIGTESKS